MKTARWICFVLLFLFAINFVACGGLKRDKEAEDKAVNFLDRFKYFPELEELIWERSDYKTLEEALNARLFTITFRQTDKKSDNFYLCVFPDAETKAQAVQNFSDDLNSITYKKGSRERVMKIPTQAPRVLFQDPKDATVMLLYDGFDVELLQQLSTEGYTTLRASVGEPYRHEYRALMVDSEKRLALLFDPAGGYELLYLPNYNHPLFFANGAAYADPEQSNIVQKTEQMLAIPEGAEMTLFFQRETGEDGWPRKLAHPITVLLTGKSDTEEDVIPMILEKIAFALYEGEVKRGLPGAGRNRPGVKYRVAKPDDLAEKLRASETYTIYLSTVMASEYVAELMTFPSEAEANAAINGINSEFTKTAPPNKEGNLKWPKGARLYQQGKYLILYASNDLETIEALDQVFGEPKRLK